MSIVFAPSKRYYGFKFCCVLQDNMLTHVLFLLHVKHFYFSDCNKFLIIIVLCLGFGFAIFEMRSHKSCLGKWWDFCWDLWDVPEMTQMLPSHSLTPAMFFRHLRCYLEFGWPFVVTHLSQPCFLNLHPPHQLSFFHRLLKWMCIATLTLVAIFAATWGPLNPLQEDLASVLCTAM